MHTMMNMKKPPDWTINPILAIASLFVFGLLLEVVCRVFPCTRYREFRINDPYYYIETIGQVRHHIPYYTYKERVPLRFDTHSYYGQTNGLVCFHSNQFGARWVEPNDQNVGESVILLLGDSFVYGHGLHYQDTFAHRLQRSFEEEGCPIDILNFAERGADARDVLDTYLKLADLIDHSLVLYGLHINDLVHFSTSSAITNLLAVPWLVKHSRGFEFMVEMIEKHWFRKYKIGRMTSSSQFAKRFFAENMDAIVALEDLTCSNGARLCVIVFPILLDLNKDTFSSLYAGIIEQLERRGIEHIDLTECLRDCDDEDVWILPFDQHPNDRANQVFMEIVLSEFRRRGLPASPSTMRTAYRGTQG
jgi:hypothetical protein